MALVPALATSSPSKGCSRTTGLPAPKRKEPNSWTAPVAVKTEVLTAASGGAGRGDRTRATPSLVAQLPAVAFGAAGIGAGGQAVVAFWLAGRWRCG